VHLVEADAENPVQKGLQQLVPSVAMAPSCQ
jgi:hypothetical protein